MLKVATDRNFTIFQAYLFYHDFTIKNIKVCD